MMLCMKQLQWQLYLRSLLLLECCARDGALARIVFFGLNPNSLRIRIQVTWLKVDSLFLKSINSTLFILLNYDICNVKTQSLFEVWGLVWWRAQRSRRHWFRVVLTRIVRSHSLRWGGRGGTLTHKALLTPQHVKFLRSHIHAWESGTSLTSVLRGLSPATNLIAWGHSFQHNHGGCILEKKSSPEWTRFTKRLYTKERMESTVHQITTFQWIRFRM
jgi:hypothetical protein